MIKIAICDDTMAECNELEEKICKVLNVSPTELGISKHDNYFSFMTYILDEVKGHIDLICVGLLIKNYYGFMLAQSIVAHYPHIKVIFVTRHFELIQEVFTISPMYLLIKPYQQKYVSDAIMKAMRTIDEDRNDFLVLKAKYGRNGIVTIKLRDIYYAVSDKRKVTIHGIGENIEVNMKLDELEEKLDANFIRCHQSFLVNMDKILTIKKDKIILYNDEVIPISKSRANQLKQAYSHYLNIPFE